MEWLETGKFCDEKLWGWCLKQHFGGGYARASFRCKGLEHWNECLQKTRVPVVRLQHPKPQSVIPNLLYIFQHSFLLLSSSFSTHLELAFKGWRFYSFWESSDFNKILHKKRLQDFRCAGDTFKQDALCTDNSMVLGDGVNSPNPSKFQLFSKCSKSWRCNREIFCNLPEMW